MPFHYLVPLPPYKQPKLSSGCPLDAAGLSGIAFWKQKLVRSLISINKSLILQKLQIGPCIGPKQSHKGRHRYIVLGAFFAWKRILQMLLHFAFFGIFGIFTCRPASQLVVAAKLNFC